MKLSAIYTLAASLVASQQWRYGCVAIDKASANFDSNARKRYIELFMPSRDEAPELYIYGSPQDRAWGRFWGDDQVDCRVLSLCFMAAIAADSAD